MNDFIETSHHGQTFTGVCVCVCVYMYVCMYVRGVAEK